MTELAPAPTWLPPRLLPAPVTVTVTPQQALVLGGWCEGMTDFAIGRRLYVAEETVKTHGRRLRERLGATNRAHAVGLVCTGAVRIVITHQGVPQ